MANFTMCSSCRTLNQKNELNLDVKCFCPAERSLTMYNADAAQTRNRPSVVATALSSAGGLVRITAWVSDQCKACTKRALRLDEACILSAGNI